MRPRAPSPPCNAERQNNRVTTSLIQHLFSGSKVPRQVGLSSQRIVMLRQIADIQIVSEAAAHAAAGRKS